MAEVEAAGERIRHHAHSSYVITTTQNDELLLFALLDELFSGGVFIVLLALLYSHTDYLDKHSEESQL